MHNYAYLQACQNDAGGMGISMPRLHSFPLQAGQKMTPPPESKSNHTVIFLVHTDFEHEMLGFARQAVYLHPSSMHSSPSTVTATP
jgi:hypothetical protein